MRLVALADWVEKAVGREETVGCWGSAGEARGGGEGGRENGVSETVTPPEAENTSRGQSSHAPRWRRW